MLLTLEREGLISRRAGVPRSIAVMVDRALLPPLEPAQAQPVKITAEVLEVWCGVAGEGLRPIWLPELSGTAQLTADDSRQTGGPARPLGRFAAFLQFHEGS
jgi:hypothetical protein